MISIRRLALLALAVLGTSTVHAASPAKQCDAGSFPAATIIFEKFMPQSGGARIDYQTYASSVKVTGAMATRHNSAENITTCTARYEVEAKSGLDANVDRLLQMNFARQPDRLFAIGSKFVGDKGNRRYVTMITYTVQPIPGDMLVNVWFDDADAAVTVGLLKAKQDVAKPKAPPPKADAYTVTRAEVEAAFTASDQLMGETYTAAKKRLNQSQAMRLDASHVKFIKDRDKSCDTYHTDLDALLCVVTTNLTRIDVLRRIATTGFL